MNSGMAIAVMPFLYAYPALFLECMSIMVENVTDGLHICRKDAIIFKRPERWALSLYRKADGCRSE
nr:hypothetical protein [Clostridia bacterium]